jgi:ATP/maltotriose-dependent transcriptional regulator MalT
VSGHQPQTLTATAGLELGGRAQAGNAAIYHAAQLFVLLREQDRSAELAPVILDIIARFPLPLYECWLACVLADTGRDDEAAARLDNLASNDFARIRPNALWLGSMASLADVCVHLGNVEWAEALYRHLRPYGARRAMVGVPVCLGSVSYYLGRLAIVLGQTHDAEAHLAAAASSDRRMGAQPWLAWTRVAQADLVEADGSGRARELLTDGRRVAERLGMVRLLNQITTRSTRTPGGPAAPATGLSRREQEVLGLIADGLSNKAIAADLVITVNTVERHLVSIYRKLGVSGRAAAAVHAVRQGGFP